MLKEEFRDLKDHISGGIIPATANPWTPGPEYDLVTEDLHNLVEFLTDVDGVKAVIANAHTGETKMQDDETYVEVVEEHVAAAGDTPVFAGVYGESSTEAAKLAQKAKDAGADAVMLLPLDVYSHQIPQEPIDHFKYVGETVDIPLINFQFPTWGSSGLPISAHVEICKLPHVIAFKEASFDPVRYDRTVRAVDHVRDDFTLMTGNDTFLKHAYHMGAETGLIGYGNVVPDLHVEKIRAVHDGDLERAQEIREQMLPLTNHIFGEPEGRYRARTKAALKMQGIFQYDTLLPPQQQISHEEREDLREILEDLGRLEEP
ncbi:dihydrodipicolinate synthase family protein [Haloarchaeobius sp. DFWS5]|uniref:dihydrodipicolinate synthase family protein n=1 Tax=Haloarchaeobius sp. DFWS5 TaxID=3446114 RepID=UPI003EC059D2